ncbi:hypothetical protein DC522_31700 [Microvirga sp. KLBC 81]|nr:hypothetical protein DC522_31700 [Microvirga sp. KLBC 81]
MMGLTWYVVAINRSVKWGWDFFNKICHFRTFAEVGDGQVPAALRTTTDEETDRTVEAGC